MACYTGKNMDNKLTLMELGVGPNGTIQLEMQSADPVNTPIKAIRPRQEYHMPDVITVRVASGQIHITIHRFIIQYLHFLAHMWCAYAIPMASSSSSRPLYVGQCLCRLWGLWSLQ